MKKILLGLVLLTVVVSVGGIFIPALSAYLALSRPGIEHLYFWQLLTYVLVEPGPFSFAYAIQLAFNMYVLWIFGISLMERAHPRLFFFLYFGSTLLAGLASLLFPHAVLAGSTPAVYAVLTAWMILNQEAKLLLFFTLPIRAPWVVTAIIAVTLFLAISVHDWVYATALLVSVLYGYLFTLIAWREQGPFAILRPFEKRILRLLEKKKESYHHTKIYDIKSGAPVLDDEQFMDAMLDRISRHGEDSLTREERKRMEAISARKR